MEVEVASEEMAVSDKSAGHEFEVLKITSRKDSPDGLEHLYEVHWKDGDITFEPVSNLSGASDALRVFLEENFPNDTLLKVISLLAKPDVPDNNENSGDTANGGDKKLSFLARWRQKTTRGSTQHWLRKGNDRAKVPRLLNKDVEKLVETPQEDAPITPLEDAPITPLEDASITPQDDAPITPQEDAPITPQEDVPITSQEDAPITPQEDVPITPPEDAPITPQEDASITSQEDAPLETSKSTVPAEVEHQNKLDKDPTELAEHKEKKQLIDKREIKKLFFCSCCALGFNDLEEYKHHNDDEEHKYLVERRKQTMVPGLGYCAACIQIIQSANYWNTHTIMPKHSKCIASLEAIGITGDYSKPLGCTVSGQLGEPINATEINGSLANSNGYGKHSNAAGQPIIGLNFVKILTVGAKEDFKCEVCDASFRYAERMQHLSGIKHRQSYLKKYYNEWFEEVSKIPATLKHHLKNRLLFFAHKVEELEKEKETIEAKALREKFFNLEKFLQENKNSSKKKTKRKQEGTDPTRTSEPIHTAHNIHGQKSGPSRLEAPLPRPGGRVVTYDPRFPPPKRMRSGTYAGQYEMDQAMEAINVLERFSLQGMRDKMQKMREAVMRGARLSDIPGYSEMMSSVKGHSGGPPHAVGQASFPPGHYPRTPHLVGHPQPYRGSQYGGPHFGGPPTPGYMMYQGHRMERPGHYRR